MTWASALDLLNKRLDLPEELVRFCMRDILEGKTDNAIIKEFLLALKAKGESAEEVGALVEEMYEHSAPIYIPQRAVDIVGTGGDGMNTINISTTAAIVAAAAGAVVVKHGNRAATSKCGSADLLETLGVAINLDGKLVAESVNQTGIGFCFAPNFHPAMKNAAAARKELGTPTIFNILGPLANPAKPKAAAIGVAKADLHLVMAEVLGNRSVEGFVFRGDDGLDELTLTTSSQVLTIGNGEIESGAIDPREVGLKAAKIEDLVGGDAQFNAAITNEILAGKSGAHRDAVVFNAGAAIAAYLGELDRSMNDRIKDGVLSAQQAIDSGAARAKLAEWVIVSQQLSLS
jgi:anthranilate phosphoribosyltransferase